MYRNEIVGQRFDLPILNYLGWNNVPWEFIGSMSDNSPCIIEFNEEDLLIDPIHGLGTVDGNFIKARWDAHSGAVSHSRTTHWVKDVDLGRR